MIIFLWWRWIKCMDVLIRKGRTKLASSNPTPRVQQRCLPPKISGPPGTMEFSNDDIEEEELSNELVAS
jgi:hypothetical protein